MTFPPSYNLSLGTFRFTIYDELVVGSVHSCTGSRGLSFYFKFHNGKEIFARSISCHNKYTNYGKHKGAFGNMKGIKCCSRPGVIPSLTHINYEIHSTPAVNIDRSLIQFAFCRDDYTIIYDEGHTAFWTS